MGSLNGIMILKQLTEGAGVVLNSQPPPCPSTSLEIHVIEFSQFSPERACSALEDVLLRALSGKSAWVPISTGELCTALIQ